MLIITTLLIIIIMLKSLNIEWWIYIDVINSDIIFKVHNNDNGLKDYYKMIMFIYTIILF